MYKNKQGVSEEKVAAFRKQLKATRQLLGYTIVQMGEELGVHHTSISRWERGACVPLEDLKVLTDILNYMQKKLA